MLSEFIINFDEWLNHLSTLNPFGIYVVLFAIVFIETAFFPLAPILPGDGLLFMTGILAASGSLNFFVSALATISGGVFGNLVAYTIGRRLAPQNGVSIKLLKYKNYLKAQKFYSNSGERALFYSRFIPIVRSIVPLVAGIALMDRKKFIKYSIASVALWVFVIMSTAYFLGHIVWIKRHFTNMILILTAVSTLPIFILWVKLKLVQQKR